MVVVVMVVVEAAPVAAVAARHLAAPLRRGGEVRAKVDLKRVDVGEAELDGRRDLIVVQLERVVGLRHPSERRTRPSASSYCTSTAMLSPAK